MKKKKSKRMNCYTLKQNSSGSPNATTLKSLCQAYWSSFIIEFIKIELNVELIESHLRFNIWHCIDGSLYMARPIRTSSDHVYLLVQYNIHEFRELKSFTTVTSFCSPVVRYTCRRLWPSRHVLDSSKVYRNNLPTKPIMIKYPSVLLAWSDDICNYYHLLFDLCGRIKAAEKINYHPESAYVIIGQDTKLIRNVIQKLFPYISSKIQFICSEEVLFRQVSIPIACEPAYLDAELIHALNTKISGHILSLDKNIRALPQGKRIYIKRGKAHNGRRIVNEDTLCKDLARHGYSIVTMDELEIDSQWQIFQNAQLIISPHGAALANLLACKPNTHIIELLPFNFQPNTYMYISNILGLIYHRMIYGCIKSQGNVNTKALLKLTHSITL